MSITVRLWDKKTLGTIKAGEDKHLITTFMNMKTFSKEEIRVYPYHLRKTYQAEWIDEAEDLTFYATDDESAIWFLRQEYTTLPDYLTEVITTYREVDTIKP